MTVTVYDVWESSGYTVSESEVDSEVDGKVILAKVTGPAFFPDSISGNNVEYPADVWDESLSDPSVVQKIDDRLMLGTIGHDEKMNDDSVRKGLCSHIVTKLWVGEDGIGYGEYLVLNTPVGQVLNTLLRAKCKLRVSTKAKGVLTNPDSRGVRTLTKYYLERVDFVTVPGFDDALPSVVESLKSLNSATQADLDPINEEDQMHKVVELLEQRLAELKTEVSESKEENKDSLGKLNQVNEALVAVKSALAKYEAIGTPEEISEALTKAAESIRSLKASLDSVGELSVNEALLADNVNEELESYRELGTLDEINQLIDTMESMADEREQEVLESLRKKYKATPTVIGAMSVAYDGDITAIEEALKQSVNEAADDEEEKKDDDKKDDDNSSDKSDKSDDDSGKDDKKDDDDVDEKGKSKVNESLNRHNRLYGTSRQLRTANIVGKHDVNESKETRSSAPRALRLMGGK